MNGKLIKNVKFRTLAYIILYTLLFAAVAAVCFAYFIIERRSFVSTDGYRQHLVAFIYYGDYLRSIVKTLITTHKLVIPEWSFSIGMGGDIFTTLSYYVIGDPLNLISVFFRPQESYRAFDFLVVFRMYLAGLMFSLYCKYKRSGGFFAILSGALIYSFVGFVLFAGITHPFFINPMIYLPLLILGVDKIFDGKRPYLFVVMVFISAISNFYFFYMLVLVVLVYVVIKLIYTFDKKDIKKSVGIFFRVGVTSTIGVLLSSFSLIPNALAVLGDGRNASEFSIDLLYRKEYYLSAFSSFVQADTSMGYNTYMGFTAIPLVCIILLFLKRKEHTFEKILFTFATAMLLFPCFAHIANGFSYVANRWIWAYAMLLAYIVVLCFKDLINASVKELVVVASLLGVYAIICFLVKESKCINVFVALAAAFVMVLFLLAVKLIKDERLEISKKSVVLHIVAFAVAFNGFSVYYMYDEDFASKFKLQEIVGADFLETYGGYVYDYTDRIGDTDFFRYSVNYESLTYNKNLLDDTKGVSFYWSLQNSATAQFLDEMEKPERYLFRYTNMDRRAAINYLLGVKYYHSTKNIRVPYGYDATEQDNIYKTENALPLAFTYSDYFTREDYEKMNAVEKQEALLSSAMLEKDIEGFEKATVQTTSRSVEYTVEDGKNASVKDGCVTVSKPNSEITLKFEAPENCEIYIRGSFDDYAAPNNAENGGPYVDLTFYPFTDKGKCAGVKYSCLTKYDVKYEGRKQFVAALSYMKKSCKGVTVKFDKAGTYSFTNVEVICLPMNNIEKQISDLKAVDTSDFKVDTNKISGNIELDENKLLCFSVPYSTGWSAEVDSKECELLQADTMLCALPLEKGSHRIELTYKTPYLRPSALISFSGLVAFGAYIIIHETTLRKKKADELSNEVQQASN